ncbi:MAG: class I SAM-dependent methyltransferase [Patescibacteria group bacterium]
MACFICNQDNLFNFLDLGLQPPSNAFIRKEDLSKSEEIYSLKPCFCEFCGLVQLNYIVDPRKIFIDYVYNTSTNNSLKENFQNLVGLIVGRFNLKKGDFAVDIGSNDGTLLSYYLPRGIKILGVDPSNVTKLALEKNIPTIVDFFSERVAADIIKKYGQAKAVTATNVFAHVDKLYDFMAGITKLLAKDGVFISESQYLLDTIAKLHYDLIYHEHLRYYSLKPLAILFNKFGMEIFDAERISSHGGSIRVYAAKSGEYPVSESVAALMKNEESSGLYRKETFTDFADKVSRNKFEFLEIIKDIKGRGQRIVGIGAPAKGNTLLNYYGMNPDIIDYLVEKSELKIGTFAPGTRIPVVAESKLFKDQPEYALLLSWNLADELIPKIRNKGYKGKFIVPMPKPTVL